MALKYQYTKSAGCIKTPNNQVPVLYSLSTYFAYIDTPVWISANGTNFRDYSRILFTAAAASSNVQTITPTFYSSSLLTFTIPENLEAGTYLISVSNGTNSSLTSAALSFIIVKNSGDTGAQGPQGPQGDQGPAGTNGTNGT